MSLKDIVNEKVAQALANNYDKLMKSKINIIHPDVYLKYSSVNVFCGRQGKGKTLSINKEMVKLSKFKNDVHLLVFVNKDGRIDETTEALKSLISIPIKYISVDDVEEYLKDLYFHKLIYDKIKAEHLEDKLDDEQIEEVLTFLGLDDFERDSLQEVILFDDAAFLKILQKKDSLIVGMCHEARHYKFIFCFCVQGVKDIPLPIKEQTTTFFLYSGFMNQKLPTIYQQSGIKNIDYQEFKHIYNQLGEKDYIIVDCGSGTFEIADDADLTPLISYFKRYN